MPTGWPEYFEQKQQTFVFRAINRLDRDTTGLLIVAKNALSSCILSDMVKKRQIHRTYLAAVNGNLSDQPEETIDVPIARLPGSTIARIPDPVHGESAVTHYPAALLSIRDGHLPFGNPSRNRAHPPDPCSYGIASDIRFTGISSTIRITVF